MHKYLSIHINSSLWGEGEGEGRGEGKGEEGERGEVVEGEKGDKGKRERRKREREKRNLVDTNGEKLCHLIQGKQRRESIWEGKEW